MLEPVHVPTYKQQKLKRTTDLTQRPYWLFNYQDNITKMEILFVIHWETWREKKKRNHPKPHFLVKILAAVSSASFHAT